MQEGFTLNKQKKMVHVKLFHNIAQTRDHINYMMSLLDNLNGNFEVDSVAYDGGNVDMTGNTITSISVLPRTSNDVYTARLHLQTKTSYSINYIK